MIQYLRYQVARQSQGRESLRARQLRAVSAKEKSIRSRSLEEARCSLQELNGSGIVRDTPNASSNEFRQHKQRAVSPLETQCPRLLGERGRQIMITTINNNKASV